MMLTIPVILRIILAGMIGTLFMTIALYLFTAFTKKISKWWVFWVLWSPITPPPAKGLSKKPTDVFIGLLLHYLIGVFFAFIYYYLWDSLLIKADFIHTLLLGFLNGCFAAGWWTCFIYFHKNPPSLAVLPYVSAVGMSHILFSTGVYLVMMA